MKKELLAIVVLYNPNMDLVNQMLDIISVEVDFVWISDNSSTPNFVKSYNNVHYCYMNGNKGIAYAQNRGIEFAINQHFDNIIFFDQDSTFEKGFIKKLYGDFNVISKFDKNAMGLGPLAINRDSNTYLGKKSSIISTIEVEGKVFQQVREFMSSSTIMHTSVFINIGLLLDELFIDCVDYEILWRAYYELGAHFYRTTNTVIKHQLGEGDRKVLGRNSHICSVFRIYYEIRNVLIVSSFKYTPLKWKYRELLKILLKLVYYPIFVTPRGKYFKNALLGIRDGIYYYATKKYINSMMK